MELIRIAFNVGFYQGIGYQIDYARKLAEEEERKEQEQRKRHEQEQAKRAEESQAKTKRGRKKSA